MAETTPAAPPARTRHDAVNWLLGILIAAPVLAALVPLSALLVSGGWLDATAFLLWAIPAGIVATFLVATAAALYERNTLRSATGEGLAMAFFIPLGIVQILGS